jgi:purine-binding chemotaxis protein CheW
MVSMRKTPPQTYTLDDPQQALRVYLDALLCEVAFAGDDESANAPLLEVETQADVSSESASIAVETFVDIKTTDSPAEAPVEAPQEAAETEPQKPTAKIIHPDWGQARFQCLSFQVAGITLAAPLEKLHGIVELEEKLTELPGYAPWVMGLLPNRGQNVQVVDIAHIIMPTGHRTETPLTSEQVKYVILVDSGRFGLAVDSLSQVMTLEPDAVRWRSDQSKRPWLAGTVVEHMCAVLDIDCLTEQLVIGLKDFPITDG